MRVRIALRARLDLAEIGDWISQDSLAAANNVLGELIWATERLDKHSLRYPVIPGANVRKRPCGKYLIFYRVTEHVEVLRILHGARDWASLLDDGD